MYTHVKVKYIIGKTILFNDFYTILPVGTMSFHLDNSTVGLTSKTVTTSASTYSVWIILYDVVQMYIAPMLVANALLGNALIVFLTLTTNAFSQQTSFTIRAYYLSFAIVDLITVIFYNLFVWIGLPCLIKTIRYTIHSCKIEQRMIRCTVRVCSFIVLYVPCLVHTRTMYGRNIYIIIRLRVCIRTNLPIHTGTCTRTRKHRRLVCRA